jgi:hypothetical protein
VIDEMPPEADGNGSEVEEVGVGVVGEEPDEGDGIEVDSEVGLLLRE